MAASSHRIVIAVDFGTTFSAISTALVNLEESSADKTVTPDVIQQYPSRTGTITGKTYEKVPTQIYYEDNIAKCGSEIGDARTPIRFFKLRLDPESVSGSDLGKRFPQHQAAASMSMPEATKATEDYLRWLLQHAIAILTLQLGESVVNTTPKFFVNTVPAIWSDAAKWITRLCAKNAGFGDEPMIVNEPEAAVFYGLSTIVPQELVVGDKFVVIDAGGGTIDLISYMIETLDTNIKVREVVRGAGKVAGGVYVDELFSEYLTKRFSKCRSWAPEVLEFAREHFELRTKVDFDGQEDDYLVPVPGLFENAHMGVKRGQVRIPCQDMKDIFEPVIAEIIDVLEDQMAEMDGVPRAVLLVGGFGQSPYLLARIRAVLDPSIKILLPAHARTAVCRGAAMKGVADVMQNLSKIAIGSRIARKSYGLSISTSFEARKHLAHKKFWSLYHGKHLTTIINPVMKQGQIVVQIQPVVMKLHRTKLVSDGPLTSHTVRVLAHDSPRSREPPMYESDGWNDLVSLDTDLSVLPIGSMRIVQGNDGKQYYRLDYEIRTHFFSAHTEYSLWFRDQCYGKVNAEYV